MTKSKDSTNHQYDKVPTKENLCEIGQPEVPTESGYGIRHIQLVIILIALSVSFISRGHLGVTIVAMTNVLVQDNYSYKNVELPAENISRNTFSVNDTVSDESPKVLNGDGLGMGSDKTQVDTKPSWWNAYKTYNWPKPVQEMVLSSFFLGYCIMMFPIGMVCQRWGGKIPLQISLFVNGIVSILTPWLAMWGGWKAVCLCRTLQGLSQAGTYPGIQTLLAKWVPTNERATLSSYVYTGSTIGTVISFQISGLLADSRWGWPSTFWVVGVLSLLAFAGLTIFGKASPRDHKTISNDEKNYILGRIDDGLVQKRNTPWKAILTSKPIWASFTTHVGSSVAFIFFFTQVPSYIHYTLGINVRSSGLLSSLPYVASFFTSIGFGLISDYFTNKKIVSVKNARRISNSISQVGISVALICATYASSTAAVVTCLVIGLACHIGIHTGWMVNHIDLSPNYSGTIMSIGNILMNMFVLILPVVVSNIVVDVTNPYQWRIMISLVATLAFICNAIFVFMMSSETQPWDEDQTNGIPLQKSKLGSTEEREPKQ